MMSPDPAPHEPMDDLDFAILDGIRELFERADPMPADLPERIRFSLAMRDLEAEVARLAAAEQPHPAGARGAERSRTVTFDSDSLTIMIRIDFNRDGTVRIDGWLAPAQRREIEMQAIAETLHIGSDEQGRFVFPSVPRGTVRLVILAVEQGPEAPGRSVVTPALVL
jgi:hypothetical protein